MKDTLFSVKKTLNITGMLHILEQPLIMGIINMTPDSFYKNSRVNDDSLLLKTVEMMLNDGADIIDLGGYSSRPGASPISEEEEYNRVIPAVRSILKYFSDTLISVDTFRSGIAREASREGVAMINDISGGQMDEKMFETISDLKIPYVLMHMRGDPQSMSQHTHYNDLFKEIVNFFKKQVSKLNTFGVADVILDPGFGFAKTLDQNYELLKNFTYFELLGFPLLVGISRKSMIFKVLDVQPSEALNGTTALNTIALMKKASILRVHDIKEAKQIIHLMEKLVQ